MNITDFYSFKKKGRKIVMLTCYDYTSAAIVQASNVDAVLVGDSAAMVMHGHPTTIPADIGMMVPLVSSVVRATRDKLIVADMPFLSYRKSVSETMHAVEALMKAGAHAIKLEGIEGIEDVVRHIVDSGVPVMGHLGLTPQSINQLGGYRVQARDDLARQRLAKACLASQQAGCFSIVLECVPDSVAANISASLDIATIGIGAGPATDGQVLVMQDLLGLGQDFKPKFVRPYLNGYELLLKSFNDYARDVREGDFPSRSESYAA